MKMLLAICLLFAAPVLAAPDDLPLGLKKLYPAAVSGDYRIEDRADGQGPRLIFFNVATLGPQPNTQQIADAAAAMRTELAAAAAFTDNQKAALRTLIAKMRSGGNLTATEQRQFNLAVLILIRLDP